jgi:hypothetical protein
MDRGANGLSKISPFEREVNLYSFVKGEVPDNSIKNVRAVYKDSSGLWLGTAGDGLIHALPDGTFTRFSMDPVVKQYGFNYVNCIIRDGRDNLFLGTSRGVRLFNVREQKKSKDFFWGFGIPEEKRPLLQIWSLLLLNQDTLLIGCKDSGLVCLNIRTMAYKKYPIPGPSATKTETYSIWYIHRDSNGKVWLGTTIGLVQYDPVKSGGVLTPVKPTNTKFPGNNIFHIHEDGNGNLWLAFVDGGLVKYDPKTSRAAVYSTEQGLPSNIVCGILEEAAGNLWVSTTSGLCVFDPGKGTVTRRYTASDGLQSNHFYFKSCASYKGEMFFGGINGVTSFYPEKLPVSTRPANVFITSFKRLYKEVEGVEFGSSVTVPYDQNTFTFEFGSNDLTNPEKNRFAYKLVGETKDWIVLDEHYLAFNSLPPGNYTLMVKATNSNNEWGPVSSLQIRVNPPFWRTWWFILISSLVALGILFLIAIEIYKRKDAQRKQVISELAALRNQLNPHFIFNSLGSLQHFIISNQKTLALEYLSKFSRMMRMILEYSTQETISLEEEIYFLHIYMYMEATRADHAVAYEIDADDIPNSQAVRIPPMLLQPLIENAIVHGLVAKREGGKITLRFSKNESYLVCEVEDNGVGREAAEAHKKVKTEKPMAMNIIRERLSMLAGSNGSKGSIEIIDVKNTGGEPKGTRVLLKIPYITANSKRIYA